MFVTAKKSGGFLLAEALISLSLLFVGLLVCLDSLAVSRSAEKRRIRSERIADCAMLAMADLSQPFHSDAPACEEEGFWKVQIHAQSEHMEHIQLSLIRSEDETSPHVDFEILRPIE